jgi:hypothetical protein
MTTALSGRVNRLEHANAGRCPICADWPDRIEMKLIEVIVEVRPDGTVQETETAAIPPAEREATCFKSCPGCGRTHEYVVVEIEADFPERGQAQ